jgi:TonB family protein
MSGLRTLARGAFAVVAIAAGCCATGALAQSDAQPAPAPAKGSAPAPDVGLSCTGPGVEFPADFMPAGGFAGATVVVRGEVTAPAGSIGDVVVDSPSGYPALDDAAVRAFRAMKCTMRAPLKQAVWVRRAYKFSADAKP